MMRGRPVAKIVDIAAPSIMLGLAFAASAVSSTAAAGGIRRRSPGA